MNHDTEKVDEVVLALLTWTLFRDGGEARAWKGHAWEVMDRLFDQGWISDPQKKSKSVWLTDAGEQRAKELFAKHFAAKSV